MVFSSLAVILYFMTTYKDLGLIAFLIIESFIPLILFLALYLIVLLNFSFMNQIIGSELTDGNQFDYDELPSWAAF